MENLRICKNVIILATVLLLPACSTNPATGEQQFTGLMSPQQEASVGASEHEKIVKEYGGVYNHAGLQAYVNEIGQKLARNTERPDVTYKFTLLDSPVVNAFALPGGYIYVTRGTLAVANSEDELAGVIGHEIGHVTARHQAARYSEGVVTQLGASILAAVVRSPAVNQALSVGTNLYMSSYSREQESEADRLGIRYLSRAGYNTQSMANFLANMENYQTAEAKIKGKETASAGYFSSHPDTDKRVGEARAIATNYPQSRTPENARYFAMLRGMTFGESAAQGFMRGRTFYHPDIGFALQFPEGFAVDNTPAQLIAKDRSGSSVIILDMDDRQNSNRGGEGMDEYLAARWVKNGGANIERTSVNGMDAATVAVQGTLNNRPVNVRLVAIAFSPRDIIRLQIVIPASANAGLVDDLKRTTYSVRHIGEGETRGLRPTTINLVKAAAGDTAQTLSRHMNTQDGAYELFLGLNGLAAGQPLVTGRTYKVAQ